MLLGSSRLSCCLPFPGSGETSAARNRLETNQRDSVTLACSGLANHQLYGWSVYSAPRSVWLRSAVASRSPTLHPCSTFSCRTCPYLRHRLVSESHRRVRRLRIVRAPDAQQHRRQQVVGQPPETLVQTRQERQGLQVFVRRPWLRRARGLHRLDNQPAPVRVGGDRRNVRRRVSAAWALVCALERRLGGAIDTPRHPA